MDASSLLDLENDQENKLREQLLIDVRFIKPMRHLILNKSALKMGDNNRFNKLRQNNCCY